jgi:hypothetical protein
LNFCLDDLSIDDSWVLKSPSTTVLECPYPLSCRAFHTTGTVTSFFHSKVARQVPPLLPSPPGLFITVRVRECPSPTLGRSGHPALFTMSLFFFSCLFVVQLMFFFFSLCRGWSVQGATLICPRVVCGSSACHLLVHLLLCISLAG